MRSLSHSYLDRAGEETRLVVETLLQVIPGTQIVAMVTNLERPIPGFELEPLVGTDAERAFDSIRERVRLQLSGDIPFGPFSCVVLGVEWGVLVDSIVIEDGDVVGALVVARHGRTWSGRER